MDPISWITGKVAGPVFGIAFLVTSIVFAVTVGVYHLELANMTAARDKLDLQINAAGTGWVARSTQCLTNFGTVSAALDGTRAEIVGLAKATAENDAKMVTILGATVAGLRDVKTSADKLIASPPTAPIGSIAACRAGARILKTGAP